MPKIKGLILGSQSFAEKGPKIGSQFIAESLARRGMDIDYIPSASSPFDITHSSRWGRLDRAIRRGGAYSPADTLRLTEYTPKSLIPAHKFFCHSLWQLKLYSLSLPNVVQSTQYDFCIFDMCANTLFLDHVNAKSLICRVNDWPRGFSDGLSKLVINHLEILIRSKRVREFWAVSKPLAKWVTDLNPHANVIYIPNGVSENIRAPDNRCSRMHKSAIFVGGNTPWIDFKLVYETAKILSDWQFHFYHPGSPKHSPSNRNIKFMGAILDGDLPDLLNKYEVGLIPYRDTDGRFLYVERPLKFYQYVAAGLGVACTDIGSLRSGMAEHASFGNDPISFSQAILNEQKRATSRPVDQILEFLFLNSWAQRCEEVHERIIKLTQTSQ